MGEPWRWGNISCRGHKQTWKWAPYGHNCHNWEWEHKSNYAISLMRFSWALTGVIWGHRCFLISVWYKGMYHIAVSLYTLRWMGVSCIGHFWHLPWCFHPSKSSPNCVSDSRWQHRLRYLPVHGIVQTDVLSPHSTGTLYTKGEIQHDTHWNSICLWTTSSRKRIWFWTLSPFKHWLLTCLDRFWCLCYGIVEEERGPQPNTQAVYSCQGQPPAKWWPHCMIDDSSGIITVCYKPRLADSLETSPKMIT